MTRCHAQRVDWHRVFDDFVTLGLIGPELVERLRLPMARLELIAAGGGQLRRFEADCITRLWSEMTGKPADFLPLLVPSRPAASRPALPLAGAGEHEPCTAQRHALDMVWQQILARG